LKGLTLNERLPLKDIRVMQNQLKTCLPYSNYPLTMLSTLYAICLAKEICGVGLPKLSTRNKRKEMPSCMIIATVMK
jgi:hypothetical protein